MNYESRKAVFNNCLFLVGVRRKILPLREWSRIFIGISGLTYKLDISADHLEEVNILATSTLKMQI